MTDVRPAETADAARWARMRHALWHDGSLEEHTREIAAFFQGELPELATALVAVAPDRTLVGFAELSERPFAEGCDSRPVAYLEGWYVVPEARARGVGRALIAAAEGWARARGHRELGSDTEWANQVSAAAHEALGFERVAVIRCFRKVLQPGAATKLLD